MVQRDGQGCVLPDAGLVAGGAGLGHGLGLELAGLGNEGNLIDGQRRQIGKPQGGVLGSDLLNEGCFSQRDAVLLRQGGQGLVPGHALRKNGRLQGVIGKYGGDGVGDLLLQLGGAGGVLVFHGHQNGVLHVAEVSGPQHGADDGVDRHIQVRAPQVHPVQNGHRVIVEGGHVQHFLPGADLHGQAGIHIQRHDGVHCVQTHPAQHSGSAAPGGQRRGHGHRSPAPLFPFGGEGKDGLALRAGAGGQDLIQAVRGRVFHGGADPLFHLLFLHCQVASFHACCNFFSARAYLDSTVARGSSKSAAISRCLRPVRAWSVTICCSS